MAEKNSISYKLFDEVHSMIARRRLRFEYTSHIFTNVFLVLAFLICMLWPSILNKQFFLHSDTKAYIGGAAEAFRVIFDIESEWTTRFQDTEVATVIPAIANSTKQANTTGHGPLADGVIGAGRSPYYGAMLYTSDILGSLWVGVLLQVLCVSLAIYLSFLSIFGSAQRSILLILCFLGVATPLSFFACYLMPDVFAGIAILAISNLLVFGDRLRPWMRWVWFVLLTASLAFHTSHIVIALLLAIAGALIIAVVNMRFSSTAMYAVAAAIFLGVLSEAMFVWVVKASYGYPPLRPPFLMARTIADGPGYDYLRATCPENGFRICDYLSVLPQSTDQILWSPDPKTGIYSTADPETRRVLVEQQIAFVSEVLRHDFAGQILASLRGFLEQFVRISIHEFESEYSNSTRTLMMANIFPADYRAALKETLLYRGEFPIAPVDAAFKVVLALSCLYLPWGSVRLGARRRIKGMVVCKRGASRQEFLLFVAFVVLGVVINAAVAGVLSTPHDRYQARVIWLIPMLATFMFLWTNRQSRLDAAQTA